MDTNTSREEEIEFILSFKVIEELGRIDPSEYLISIANGIKKKLLFLDRESYKYHIAELRGMSLTHVLSRSYIRWYSQ